MSLCPDKLNLPRKMTKVLRNVRKKVAGRDSEGIRENVRVNPINSYFKISN